MGRLLQGQTLTRNVDELVANPELLAARGSQTPPELAALLGGAPKVQPGGSYAPVALQNQMTAQGPNPILAAVADAMTSFGAGPQAAAIQQGRRYQGIEDQFGRQERQSLLRSQRVQQEADLEIPEFRMDPKGNLSIINRGALMRGDTKRGFITIPKAQQTNDNIPDTISEVEGMFGVKLDDEERGMVTLGMLDANEAQDITPLRQTVQAIVSRRQKSEDEAAKQKATDDKEAARFDRQMTLQRAAFNNQLALIDKRMEAEKSKKQLLRPGQSTALGQMREVIRDFSQVNEMFSVVNKKGKIGAISSGSREFLRGKGVTVDEDFNKLAVAVSNLKNKLLKIRSGAQVTDQEMRRIAQELPSLGGGTDKVFGDSPRDFVIKMQQGLGDAEAALGYFVESLGVDVESLPRGSSEDKPRRRVKMDDKGNIIQ